MAMDKTTLIHLNGQVFYIEEVAYESLESYLDAIKSKCQKEPGYEEMFVDIELRIAELFQERLQKNRQAVTLADVAFIKQQMGEPNQFELDEAPASPASSPTSSASDASMSTNSDCKTRQYRRYYRDPDEKIIAGVCGGLSHRFAIDP